VEKPEGPELPHGDPPGNGTACAVSPPPFHARSACSRRTRREQENVVGCPETAQNGMRIPIWNSLGVWPGPNRVRRLDSV
jgi:hypothetical protein